MSIYFKKINKKELEILGGEKEQKYLHTACDLDLGAEYKQQQKAPDPL